VFIYFLDWLGLDLGVCVLFLDALNVLRQFGWRCEVAEFYTIGLDYEVETDLFPAVVDYVARKEQESKVIDREGNEKHVSVRNCTTSHEKEFPNVMDQRNKHQYHENSLNRINLVLVDQVHLPHHVRDK
jgi:hypothetical protein